MHDFLDTGDKQDQADLGVFQNNFHRIDTPIALPVGNKHGAIVERLDEARRVAAGTDTLIAFCIRRRDAQEWT